MMCGLNLSKPSLDDSDGEGENEKERKNGRGREIRDRHRATGNKIYLVLHRRTDACVGRKQMPEERQRNRYKCTTLGRICLLDLKLKFGRTPFEGFFPGFYSHCCLKRECQDAPSLNWNIFFFRVWLFIWNPSQYARFLILDCETRDGHARLLSTVEYQIPGVRVGSYFFIWRTRLYDPCTLNPKSTHFEKRKSQRIIMQKRFCSGLTRTQSCWFALERSQRPILQ